jgi:hypothetical protein
VADRSSPPGAPGGNKVYRLFRRRAPVESGRNRIRGFRLKSDRFGY